MTRVPRGRVVLLVVVAVVLAVLVQTTMVARLPLPGASPDLVLVLTAAVGLTGGSSAGLLTGFGAGLLADTQSDHELGRLALAYLVAGYLSGRFAGRSRAGRLLPFGVVLLGSVTALVVFVAEGLALGDARTDVPALGLGLVAALAYDFLLTPVVVPAIAAFLRRDAPSP